MAERVGADRTAWEAEMFRLLAENVKDYAIFVVDPNRHILSWNKGAERLLGFSEEEIVGRQCDCFFTPEDVRRGVPQKELDEALATGRGDDDRWHMRKDGTRFWAGGVVTPLKDEGGTLRGFAKIMRDRTELKRAADAARERERQLHLLTDHAPVLIAHCDADRRYKFVNKPYAARLGLHPKEVVGRRIRDVVGERAYAAIEPQVDAALAGERVVFEAELPDDGAGPQVVRAAYDPEFDDQGRVAGFVAAVVNVTESRRVRADLRESEERLRTLSDNLPHGAVYQVVAGPQGGRRFTFMSAGVERLFGVTAAEAMADASALYGLIHEEDGPRVAAAEEVALRDLSPFDCEFRSWTRTGDVRWFQCRSAHRRLPAGEVAWEGVILDVSRRKRDEAVLDGQRRVLELMVRGTPLPDVLEELCRVVEEQAGERLIATVLLLDEDGVHLRPVAGRRSPGGWTRAIDPLRVGPSAGSCGAAAYRGEQVVVADIAADPLWADFRDVALGCGLRACWSTPILCSRGRVLGTFAVYYDTPRRPDPGDLRLVDLVARTAGIAVERSRADEALREADRRKDEFLATLAHELRNPLAPIRNGLQVIKLAAGDPGAVERSRAMMERQLGQMVRLIDDLLDVSRITRGKLPLRRERVALAGVISGAVEGSRPLVEASAHRLTVTLPPEPVYLDADPTRLSQVFSNLLTNAAKYTEKGGHIRLTAERSGGEVVVSVADTGIGIAPEHLPRLFEMFSQVDTALERSQGGLGIGLSLVKGLVEMHGGTVAARSEGPGRGSEFVVRLPLADRPPAPGPGEQTGGEPAAARPRRRILVADDNADAADSLALMLRLGGHEVHAVYDGQTAVEAAGRTRPDVAILDIGMPGMSGYDAARRIRSEPWGGSVVLVALTGWGQEEDRRRATEAGFDRHLTKPVDPAALETLLAASDAAGRIGARP